MARKRKKRSTRKLQDNLYEQIVSNSRPEAEKLLQQLGLLTLPAGKLPYSMRMSAQTVSIAEDTDPASLFAGQDFSQLKEKVVAYYARPDVQREMYRYARGRYVTVLRNFTPMFTALQDPEDVLPLMFHYLRSKGSRWPSMHGTVMRHTEDGKKVCDFVFEPDYKKNWTVAFGAARPIVKLFLSMGLPFFVKFSGNTSPHVIVPGEALASAKDKDMKSREFREAVYGFVMSRMKNPGILDGPKWQPDHFLRLAYSIHELGGKVSTPIRPEEFDSFNPDRARIESVEVIENWWHIPEDAAERGREFVQQVTANYPRLVGGVGKPEVEHRWKPPKVPRKLRQIFDEHWYAKVLRSGWSLLPEGAAGGEMLDERTLPEDVNDSLTKALNMLKRWESAGLKVDLEAAADVFQVDVAHLQLLWEAQEGGISDFTDALVSSAYHYEYYSRGEVQESFYHYAAGRCFRTAGSKPHFRLQEPSDIPALAAFFASSNAKWRGFQCTRGIYNPFDNQIAACDVGMEIDFSRSDCVSAVELAQTLIAVLQRYQVFCFVKFDGSEALEIVIPASALPRKVDGQDTALQMRQIAAGLNRGFRRMPEVRGNDCILLMKAYGYTRPAYSINQETGLACVVLMPEDLQDFSPESAVPERVSVSKSWFDVPPDAPLQAQRFLKYALSPNWHPTPG